MVVTGSINKQKQRHFFLKHHSTIISLCIPTLPLGESLTRSPLRQVGVLSGSVMVLKVHGTIFSSWCIMRILDSLFWIVPLILCMQWKDEWCIPKRRLCPFLLMKWFPETYTDSKTFPRLPVGLVNFLRLTCFSPAWRRLLWKQDLQTRADYMTMQESVLVAPVPIKKDGPRKPWKRGVMFAS